MSPTLTPKMTPLTTLAMADNNLRVMTWNSRGHRMDRLEYIRKLMCLCDVLFIQVEHWFLDADISNITEYVDNVEVVGVSGMDESRLVSGRPFGGCVCYCIQQSFKCEVSQITTQSRRLCAATLTLPDDTVILLCRPNVTD